MQKKNVLILDECCGPSVYNPVCYSDFLCESDNIQLLIITSTQGLSLKDKQVCLDFKEINVPTANALLEYYAIQFHEKYRIDVIYTKQEDLILRAAHLRKLFGF